jgi:two-component system, chemotaxis family, chemotaxis protein CheY
MRTLVVEDDFVMREFYYEVLTHYGEVDFATDGKEALLLFQRAHTENRPYHLLCLDVKLPGMDGMALLSAVREMETNRGIGGLDGVKIVMATGVSDKRNILSAFRTGCEAYLVKPFDKQMLKEKMQQLKLIDDASQEERR